MLLTAIVAYLAIGGMIVTAIGRNARRHLPIQHILSVMLLWPLAIVFPLLLFIDWLRRG